MGPAAGPIEPGAGAWRTWVLASGRELRLPSPPSASATAVELGELRAQETRRDPAMLERIRYWDYASPAYRWNALLTDIGIRHGVGFAPGTRAFALLNVAISDAMIAAWDSKYAHGRKRPAELEPGLHVAVATPPSPSYPCEHSVAAGAASAIIASVFPQDAEEAKRAAEEASRSRVEAGVVFPSDARAGLELGRAVAARVIEAAKIDSRGWTGARPTGPGVWTGPNPVGIDQIRWKTFVLRSPDQFRSAPPPAADSPGRAAELAELKSIKRTPAMNAKAFFWQFGQHGQPGMLYLLSAEVSRRLAELGLDGDAPRAARAYALVHVSHYDTLIAAQDGKYHYWTARPVQFDPTITTIMPTPPFPSYPANAAALGMAPAIVLGHLFPRESTRYLGWAREFGDTRIWSGIHFRSDVEAGWELGRRVGTAVVERAHHDGAE
jgi:hypothetical protein